jgi:hypothetical protein
VTEETGFLMKNARHNSKRQIEWTDGRTGHQHSLEELRRMWQQAILDDSPRIPVEDVFDRLQKEYSDMALLS